MKHRTSIEGEKDGESGLCKNGALEVQSMAKRLKFREMCEAALAIRGTVDEMKLSSCSCL